MHNSCFILLDSIFLLLQVIIEMRFHNCPVSHLHIRITDAAMALKASISGNTTTYQTNTSATSTQDTWYDVHVVCDGQNVTVTRIERGSGNNFEDVLGTTGAGITTMGREVRRNRLHLIAVGITAEGPKCTHGTKPPRTRPHGHLNAAISVRHSCFQR